MKNKINSHNWLKGILFGVMLFPVIHLSAQQSDIRGVVVDENLLPLSGAFVQVNGVQNVLNSSEKGSFTVEASSGATILVGKNGYLSEQVKADKKSLYIILKKNPLLVNQAVAYGETKRGAITSSMSILDGEKLNNSVGALGSALYGRLPGLFMQQGQGEPGADQPLYYFIRGSITFGSASNQPMVFVDGFERDLNTIQVEDVENIAVLKDAAATAIYGARGANGVIQVTTKRGKEGAIKLNANFQYGVQSATRIPEFLSSYDYSKKYRRAYEMDGLSMSSLPGRYTNAEIENFKSGDPFYYPNIDWVKEMTKESAPRRQADVSVSGGNKIGKYYVSLNYSGVDGLYKHTESPQNWSSNSMVDRYRFRSNMDVNITDRWSLRADLSGQIDTKNRPMAATADLWNSFYKTPTNQFPIKSGTGIYGGNSTYTTNPLGELEGRGYRQYNDRTMMSNIETKYDFSDLVKGLQAGLRFGYDNSYTNRSGWSRSYQVADVLGKDSLGAPIRSNLVGTSTNLAYFGPDSDGQDDRMTFEGFLNFNRLFADKHNITSMLMYHQDKYIVDGDPKPYYYQFVGGRVGYDYKNKYFSEFSFSYSGTENFTKKNRFGFFPAISAGWMISEEDFMKSVEAVDYLKIRASTGMVGNSAVGDRFTYVKQYLSGTGWVFGNTNTGAGGLSESTFPNTNFTFEKAYKYEVGLETKLYKTLSFWSNVYLEHRTNILTTSSSLVPGIFGGTLANVNAGVTERKGIEFGISFDKQKKDWGLHVGLNGSYNINKILKINEETKKDKYLYSKGTELGQVFMLECLGFYTQEDIDNPATPIPTYGDVKPGDLKYKDQNGDSIINDNDKKPLMNGFRPKAEFGLDLAVRYKSFEVAAFFQAQVGRSVYLGDNTYIFWPLQNNSARISKFAANSWTPETAETANYPRLTTLANSNNYRASTFWYRNGDFIRLRSVELGYYLPSSLLERSKVSKIKVFVRGLNLFTWDHIGVVDPEVFSGYPVMKSYNLGLNLQF